VPGDLLPPSSLPPDAITEGVKLAGSTGRWLDKVLGTLPEDVVGLAIGDRVRYRRLGNLAALQAKHDTLLENIETQRRSEVSLSVVLPLLEAAANESREELQNLWAALLANAIIDGGKKVRAAFFETIKKMEPVDAKVLFLMANPNEWVRPPDGQRRDLAQLEATARARGVEEELAVSISALQGLGCLTNSQMGYLPSITPYGRALLAACTVS
jgi:hypothetical protein